METEAAVQGVIYKALSGFYYVWTEDGRSVACRARGKMRLEKRSPLVGDRVCISLNADGSGTVMELQARRNAFVRPAVANLDQMVFIAANVNPVTEPYLIDRVTAIAEMQNCEPVIVINKCDLDAGDALYELYTGAGFSVVRTSAQTGEGIDRLRALLEGKISAFTGNSGVGKSSILNALEPGFGIATGEVSEKLGRGRHTTRHVELFPVAGGLVADTPGFASVDTDYEPFNKKEEIQLAFREFRPYLDTCRFRDCAHVREEGCAILAAVADGHISPQRHASYVRLYQQAASFRAWEHKED